MCLKLKLVCSLRKETLKIVFFLIWKYDILTDETLTYLLKMN